MAFAFGWTPCVGPILGSILALAATEGGVRHRVALLLVYSLGIGVPFLATALLVNRFLRLLRRYGRVARGIEVFSGMLLVAVGTLILLGSLSSLIGAVPLLDRFVL